VNTFTAVSVLPGAKYSGTSADEQPSAFSLSGEAGLELHTGFFSLGATYYMERFNFTNSTRVDQFSALRFRLGLTSGRR
jgi:hypothetical protein